MSVTRSSSPTPSVHLHFSHPPTEPEPSESTGSGATAPEHPDCTLEADAMRYLGTPPGVSSTRRPAPLEAFDPIETVAIAHGNHTLLEAGAMLVSRALARGIEGVSPASTIFEYLVEGAAHEIERGERENQIYHHDRLRGFIAGLEGRAASPEARREAALHPGYRDGLAAFERFSVRATAAEVDHMLAHVRASRTAGTDAVLLGRDHGPAFERRYASDLVFHHAVDFERRERTRDPEAFAAKKAAAEERAREVALARHALPVRP